MFKARKGYSKHFGGRFGNTTKGTELSFGDYGLVATSSCQISEKSYQAMVASVKKHLKDRGRLYLTLCPDFSSTKKPVKMKMGGGCGKPLGLYSFVKRGKVVLEIGGLSSSRAQELLVIAASKAPFRTIIIDNRR